MDIILHELFTQWSTLLLFLVIAISLALLSKGADILVEEAVSLSVRWGIPKMIIGATIVSLGTTLPEATVSVLAAVKGNPDLALGNAIGSIIADTGLIIGISALLGRLPVDKSVVNHQGKLQLLAGFLLAVVALPIFSRTGNGNISQMVGGIFILLLISYIIISIRWSRTAHGAMEQLKADEEVSLPMVLIKLFIGVVLVVVSSQILISSVEITAIRIGIPQGIIAATLVAFGTSLPELVTCVTAVRKGHGEIAIGNVVGADILNVLFVIGSAAIVTKGGLDVPVVFYKLQIPAMLVILTTFRLFTSRAKEGEEINKIEGMILFGMYIIYLALNYFML
ncbi:MAG: calcium/sodium antiporter [Peptostreptococcaceae bacterium]|nr:calcium/sodium antiporter [Peptostreptococcaceae bacterium]